MQSDVIINISGAAGVVNLVLVLIVTILPQWRVNSPVASQPNLNYLRIKEGLWIRCSGYPNQYFTCDMYDSSIIGLAAYLNAFRAFMIIALLLTTSGLICSVLGMRCTTVLENQGKGKRWAVIIGGICHIVSGILTGISVSWYAAEVVRDYYDPYNYNQNIKYTFGACLYVGWISMVCSGICGCLMVCCTCFNKPADNEYTASYGYKHTNGASENFSYPAPPIYKSDPYYKEKSSRHHYSSYDRPSSRHSGRSYRSHKSRDHRSYHSHRGRRSSTSSSSDDGDISNYKSSHHESDIMRASGFV